MKYVWIDYLDNQAKRTQWRILKYLLRKYKKWSCKSLFRSDYNACIIEDWVNSRWDKYILIDEKEFTRINKEIYEWQIRRFEKERNLEYSI